MWEVMDIRPLIKSVETQESIWKYLYIHCMILVQVGDPIYTNRIGDKET
jgi:hypothetical protein